ncbi:hypothetical protein BU16DRAFT_523619 [Lophium mytilinum]|uniref:DUF6536 domain-containing protein n=1 Tax=Lophium mytilinum TaxID=390894 RepID=A0A6A6R5I7_9PEZI|nr:hypothetical protein BU16DRAFT_523619 [Lophium mytilinum]
MSSPGFLSRVVSRYRPYSMLGDETFQIRDAKATGLNSTGKDTYELVDREETLGHASTPPLSQFQGPSNSGFRAHLPPAVQRYLFSYKAGLLRSALVAGLALLLNTALDSWMFADFGSTSGSGVALRTRCRTVNGVDTSLHILLNIISTCILGASNYCMQGIGAPTREEVDAVHKRQKWADIGIQSTKNLALIAPKRVLIWALLAFTSVPFHLFFNSVFFTASQARQYAVAVVSSDFANITTWTPTLANTDPALFPSVNSSDPLNLAKYNREDSGLQIVTLLQDIQNASFRDTGFTKLAPEDCIKDYAMGFLEKHGDVAVVSKRRNDSSPLLWSRYPQRYLTRAHTNQDPFRWICQDFTKNTVRCSSDNALSKTSDGKTWTVYGQPVDYRLSRSAHDVCELQYNVWMMLAVVIFGIFKTATMIWMILQHPIGALRTSGDAIASFLDREDETTRNMCLVNPSTLHRSGWLDSFPPQLFSSATHRIRCWSSTKRSTLFLTHAISTTFGVCLAIALHFAIRGAWGSQAAFSSGFSPNIQSLAKVVDDSGGSSTLLPTLIVANLPQIVFSCVYLLYNNLFTHYALAHEWDNFAERRKGLRVSDMPRGAQRSTRFLSLPARYSIPLMAFSALLHWLLSQSLYLVRIDGVNSLGEVDKQDRIARLGYSTTGIVCVIVVMTVGILVTLAFGAFTSLRSGIMVGSNSALISAAVHPIADEEQRRQMQYKEVMWGDVSGVDRDRMDGEVRRATFSSGIVRPLIDGCVYS